MSENRPASLKGWLKCQPRQLVIITMRYNSGRGGSLIKELDLESQMESQVRGLLSDLMETLPHWWWMPLGNTHPLSTQSSATWESVGEKHPADIEIETKTWRKMLIPIQRLRLNWSRVQHHFLYSPGDTCGQPKLRNLKKYSWDNTHPFMGDLTGKPVYCGIVK